MSSEPNRTPPAPPEISSIGVLAARVVWMLLGPLALLVLAYGIVRAGPGWRTAWDAVFLLVVALMIAARWFEQRSGTATTVTGEPASPAHFRRYVRVLVPVAAVVWVAANLLAWRGVAV